MHRSLFLLLVFSPLPASFSQTVPAGYKLAFSDEFNGSSVNSGLWAYRTDTKLESTQTPDNVSEHDGNLVIALRKQEANGKHYTGGGIISKKQFHYGYYEARLKIVAGNGWHSSFWMMGYNGKDTHAENTTLELDVIENTSENLSSYSTTTHRWVAPHITRGHKEVTSPDLSRDFHIFGCEYAPDVVRYYMDGELVQTVDTSGLPQGELNIWLTSIAQALGPNHNVDDTSLPGTMYVDWIRYYAKQ